MHNTLLLGDYQPRSELVTPQHHVPRARFAAIDAHNHLPADDPRVRAADAGQLVEMMDRVNVQAIVNLTGKSGSLLELNLDTYDRAYPGRFATFCNVDWQGAGGPGWAERATRQLAADVKAGAKGLKVFKTLGLQVRDPQGRFLMPDDPRIADIWDQAGELGVPVLIHVADPVAFFRPVDRANERYLQLLQRPEWSFYAGYPPFEALIEALYRLIAAHPRTTFITAHVGCYPENLGFVSQMLDRYPNLYTDFSARMDELGRKPYSAREWFLRYADRILFGTDSMPPTERMYQTHFRFLETADEYFPYSYREGEPSRRPWNLYGLFLPDEALRRVYHDNAARLIGLP